MPQFEHDGGQRYVGKASPACTCLAQLMKFGVEVCLRFLGEVLLFCQSEGQTRQTPALIKQPRELIALPALSDGNGESLSDFDRACFVLVERVLGTCHGAGSSLYLMPRERTFSHESRMS
jgi:hypothetical protein